MRQTTQPIAATYQNKVQQLQGQLFCPPTKTDNIISYMKPGTHRYTFTATQLTCHTSELPLCDPLTSVSLHNRKSALSTPPQPHSLTHFSNLLNNTLQDTSLPYHPTLVNRDSIHNNYDKKMQYL